MAVSIDPSHEMERTEVVRRSLAFAIALGIGFAAILARLWYLQVALGDELLESSQMNRSRTIRRVASRGQIVDANGTLLATNLPRLAAFVTPLEAMRHPEALRTLCRLTGTRLEDVQAALKRDFVTNFDPVKVVGDLPIELATRIEEHNLELPGVTIALSPKRYYPQRDLTGHVIGYVGAINQDELKQRADQGYRPGDSCGKLGIEAAHDSALKGVDGATEIDVDARGRLKGELERTDDQPGATVQLYLDLGLQQTAMQELGKWAKRGHPGALVAMDPRTGGILALASAPAYDPNQFVGGISKTDWDALQSNKQLPQINRAVSSRYAPGSVFKLMVAAEALDRGVVTEWTEFKCDGVLKVGNFPKRCHKRSGHGTVNLKSALAHSCDVYFYRVGQLLGSEKLAACAKRFGFGERTLIDIAGENSPIEAEGTVPTPEWKLARKLGPWVGGDTVDYAIGQAMLTTTPLQICRAVAALGNNGFLQRPKMVQRITTRGEDGKPVEQYKPNLAPDGKLTISERSRQFVLRAMRDVVERGTAASARIEGVSVLGKTGTAQMVLNREMVDNAWFVALAPAENPTIAVAVFVEAAGHGGDVAAPIARKVIARYLKVPEPPVEAKPTPTRSGNRANRLQP